MADSRLGLVAASLLAATLAVQMLRSTDSTARERVSWVRTMASELGIVKVGDKWLPKPGDRIGTSTDFADGAYVVATDCPTCARRTMGRIIAVLGGTQELYILAPTEKIGKSFVAYIMKPTLITDKERWRKFHVEPFGAPICSLFVVALSRREFHEDN